MLQLQELPEILACKICSLTGEAIYKFQKLHAVILCCVFSFLHYYLILYMVF